MSTTQTTGTQPVHSKDMAPLPNNFGPVFFPEPISNDDRITYSREISKRERQMCHHHRLEYWSWIRVLKTTLSLGLSHLVMGVRSVERGNEAMIKLQAANSSAKIEVWELNMESYDSIQEFVRRCEVNLPHIDIIILNAGLASTIFEKVPKTGHERTIQVNHFSTALLATLFLPILKSKSKDNNTPPRLTLINSVTAHLCKFPNKDKRPLLSSFDDTAITPWDANERYGVSKLLCQLFITKLAEYINSEDVIINMVDPG